MKRITRLTAILGLIAAAASGGQEKVAPDLRNVPAQEVRQVLLRAKDDANGDAVTTRLKNNGKVKVLYPKTKLLLADLSGGDIQTLSTDAGVGYMSPDRDVKGSLDYAALATYANVAWSNNWTGAEIGIAVLDSGVLLNSDDLVGRIAGSSNLVPGQTDATDKYGHGTHVAGIIAGTGAKSTGKDFKATIRGIAHGSSLYVYRVLDANGRGKDSYVIDAIEKVIDYNEKQMAKGKPRPIHVINLSLGRPISESFAKDPLCLAVEKAWQSGIVVVVAAGNYGRENTLGNQGYGTITSPGNHPYVITVGAMNTKKTASRADDVIASYSSKGPSYGDHVIKPDIVAPGNLVASINAKDATLSKGNPNNRLLESDFKVNGGTNRSDLYFRLRNQHGDADGKRVGRTAAAKEP
jgi:serine protease AprX